MGLIVQHPCVLVSIYKIFEYLKWNGLSFWFSLDCGCTPEGTQNDGAVEICDDVSGECSCETGYTGDKCNECDAGYYDDQTNTTTTLSCTGW